MLTPECVIAMTQISQELTNTPKSQYAVETNPPKSQDAEDPSNTPKSQDAEVTDENMLADDMECPEEVPERT